MLRNAFEALATESTLRKLVQLVSYARTNTDQMRVVVDSGTLNATTVVRTNTAYGDTNSGSPYVIFGNLGAIGMAATMDPREQQKVAARGVFASATRSRWSIT